MKQPLNHASDRRRRTWPKLDCQNERPKIETRYEPDADWIVLTLGIGATVLVVGGCLAAIVGALYMAAAAMGAL